MFDVKWIRENPEAFDTGLARRGVDPQSEIILQLDSQRRQLITVTQKLQEKRNLSSKQIGVAKQNNLSVESLLEEVSGIKIQLHECEEKIRDIDSEMRGLLLQLPNLPSKDVPDGADDSSNLEVKRVGEPRVFDFVVRPHFALGESLGQMEFAAASQMSGSRFVILSGQLAKLERALAAFMLDIQTEQNGYLEVSPPFLVKESALIGTGQLPKFADDLFKTTDNRWLIPTAEVPLTNIVSGEVLKASDLPYRVTAHTPCFRSEAGAAGKDTRGMIRVHQFTKVEMVSITTPSESDQELERMTDCAGIILEQLGLPYRIVLLSSGDMGFSALKTYDLEVWIPSEQKYREISSCSNCGDFQARRMRTRFRSEKSKIRGFVHTLNGSGLAVGRALVAVMENYQRSDGSIVVPEVLRPYMGGIETIDAMKE